MGYQLENQGNTGLAGNRLTDSGIQGFRDIVNTECWRRRIFDPPAEVSVTHCHTLETNAA